MSDSMRTPERDLCPTCHGTGLAGASALRSAVSVIEELEALKDEFRRAGGGAAWTCEFYVMKIDTRIAALRSTET